MKKGVAGVRLCDVSGCYLRWPCHRHATAAGFPMNGKLIEPITPVRLEAAIELVNERFFERTPCAECGYQMPCWCAVKALVSAPTEIPKEGPYAIRAGWSYSSTTNAYYHESMPADYGVLFCDDLNLWRCRMATESFESPYLAMLHAEELYARDRRALEPPLADWELIQPPKGTAHYRNYALPPDYAVYLAPMAWTDKMAWTAAMLPDYYDSAQSAMIAAEAHYRHQAFDSDAPEPVPEPGDDD